MENGGSPKKKEPEDCVYNHGYKGQQGRCGERCGESPPLAH